MRRIAFFVVLLTVCIFSSAYAEENISAPAMERIVEIKIHVISHKVDVIYEGEDEEDLTKRHEAATASPRNAGEIPYGKVGRIWQIVLNPAWSPTKKIREEFTSKKKNLPKTIPPGRNNPLGKIKLFISFDDNNSTLGLHGTNEPKSIGKRVTHGCTRMGSDDIFEAARIILEQNGYDADELFQKAQKNPKKTLIIEIYDGPTVVHLKD